MGMSMQRNYGKCFIQAFAGGGLCPSGRAVGPPGKWERTKFCLGLCLRFHRRERSGDRPRSERRKKKERKEEEEW
jgi:hypothetical protein